jgi:hypothetical protein
LEYEHLPRRRSVRYRTYMSFGAALRSLAQGIAARSLAGEESM